MYLQVPIECALELNFRIVSIEVRKIENVYQNAK